MATISLCLIVKDEAARLDNCLKSVAEAVDEIIIVDTGSTDETKEIAKRYTEHVYDFAWCDDFSAARNESFRYATKDYILWLDADDILKPEDCEKLQELKMIIPEHTDVVYFIYNYAFDNNGNPTLTFKRERLVKRSANPRWVGFIHEYIEIQGNTLESDIVVTHTREHGNADRNLNIYKKKMEEGVWFSSRDQYYYGKELYYHGMFDECIEALEKFIALSGWIEDELDANNRLADCYLWKKDYSKARQCIYRNFDKAIPRAESLFRLAKTYQAERRYAEAIYWYELIYNTSKPMDTMGFLFDEYWTWMPRIELCVCYYYTGNVAKAIEQNDLAAVYVPNNDAVKFNRTFFDSQESSPL
ncbi:glycosyltransferase [Anaerosporobacter sp.]|uniref:glycosyltransferase n=1 Tax=Anaerosporobacter sp. TaxID=1872529 RepID=UPI00286F630A|nr:glycosyltransferase [Anaerosporobacter sp.]